MVGVWWVAMSLAGSGELLMERLTEVEELRAYRMVRSAPILTAKEHRDVANGKVVTGLVAIDGHRAKKAYGAAVFDVPIGKLWSALNDDQAQVAYTDIGYSELLAGAPCSSGRQVFEFLPLPVVTDRWWITNIRLNTGLMRKSKGRVREFAWQSSDDYSVLTSEEGRALADKGMPVLFNRGGWFLVDLDGEHTFAEYFVWTDPGGNIPASSATLFAGSSIRKAFDDMERLARDGASCPE